MAITTSRAQRRQLDRDNKKLPRALQQVPREDWPPGNHPQRAVWRSREFLVQVFDAPAPAVARLSINRATLSGERWLDNIAWDDLQRLKAECGFGDCDAVEVYPRDRDIVNVANMRHLWVLAEPLEFAWRRSGGANDPRLRIEIEPLKVAEGFEA